MSILAVDLAAKYSAAVVMDETGAVQQQWDSWGRTETGFVTSLTVPFAFSADGSAPEVVMIEDLPHRLPHSGLTKAVCRLQGRIYDRFTGVFEHDKIIFVSPATWRAHYPALRKRGSGPDAVVEVAADLGYCPPDLSSRATEKGGKATARKVTTDYCAAFLIAYWALHVKRTWDTYDVPGTSRYGEPQKRKSEE